MIFHDLLDDSEAQPGALGPRRHIGLGQPLAAIMRQALAVILDNDQHLPVPLADRDANLSGRVVAAFDDSRLYRFDCILDDVDHRLADQPRVAAQ